jgi:acetyl esterase/lipase
VYYHGGGWVIADLDTYDASPRALVNATNAVVVSAHYRQAPEHKFPAAHEDAYAAYKWVLEHAKELKGDPKRIAIVGESAGGNMAAAVSVMAQEHKMQMPIYQVLIYPIADDNVETASYVENAKAKPLSRPAMQWFFKQYLNSPADGKNHLISLLSERNLKGLPATTIITDQIDPLRSEGKAYADLLQKAGVKVRYQNYEGVTHEFFGMAAVLDLAKDAQQFAAEGLRDAFK